MSNDTRMDTNSNHTNVKSGRRLTLRREVILKLKTNLRAGNNDTTPPPAARWTPVSNNQIHCL
jgi:hypothetical protein